MVIGVAGLPTHVNMSRSQSCDGRVVPNSVPATWNLARSSMPTDFSCRWMISNVSARSWLPVVVPKRNDSLPTFGQDQIAELFAEGLSGPPVQPFAFSVLMTFVWENVYLAQLGRYADSNGLNMWLFTGFRPGAIVPYSAFAIWVLFMPVISACRT